MESEQVYDVPHSKPPKSSTNTAEKKHSHRPDEKPGCVAEGIVHLSSERGEEEEEKESAPLQVALLPFDERIKILQEPFCPLRL